MIPILKRVIYFIYIVSIIAVFGCFSLIFTLSPWFIVATVLMTGFSYSLHVVGYKHLNFDEHDNIIAEDEKFNFDTDEEYDKWNKLKKFYDEVGEQDLTPEQQNQVRKILSEMVDPPK